jgi:glycogen operon protein
VPLLLAGDELARSQSGNNNNYCHDTELSWIDWDALKQNEDIHRFVRRMIAFRHAHPVLRPKQHTTGRVSPVSNLPDISFHGTSAWWADFSPGSRVVAFMLDGAGVQGDRKPDDTLYTACNMYWDPLTFELPAPRAGMRWHVFANTGVDSPDDIFEPGQEPLLSDQGSILVGGRSLIVLVAR